MTLPTKLHHWTLESAMERWQEIASDSKCPAEAQLDKYISNVAANRMLTERAR